ncbi:hypothetical protein GCM10029976_095170 [Kribbella albertanoniae]|uniref:Uncharacterized protein n=1 Tax=Kribbella albertanoniae TaxID=1266829 RepID=A0A4V2XQY2_9ACTN|nr:hypothetical protein [Kribbella albertanoniae]TDC27075.1 hypothetical protein E1261_21320 [Kribbella albertanoniae]
MNRLLRFLMVLGALLGVFVLHSFTAETVVSESTLTAGTTVAPKTVDPVGYDHPGPCAIILTGSLLLLSAWLVLRRRQRFGDLPRALVHAGVTPAAPAHWTTPRLTQLCVLRT